ncbi:MAG TPA: SRPBCC domain-containing protein [Spirochaetia bacterium]|nr:SRPBCC domain-containing protein [Spirochaetia bacterium]
MIASTPEKVWKALTSAEFTRKYWFGRNVESDWNVGSEVTITTPEGMVEVRGKVLEMEVNKRLSYTWGSGTGTEGTVVVFEITAMGPLVKLLITHDIDLSSAGAQQAANGWTFILCGLKTLLETGNPMPAIPWRK